MAVVDVWIQLENHAWDVCPRRPIDRATAEGLVPVGPARHVFLRSPVTQHTRTAAVNVPLEGEALLLRRYTADWRAPDDRKVNPWDLNEPDPTDAGTMGTIPGAVIECNVGDTLRVHFRNMDFRTEFTPAPWDRSRDVPDLPIEFRTHSLHAHGVVYAREHDGAYPLSPPDPQQPVEATELINWGFIGVKRFKQGDRVPPGCTFTYTWQPKWPTSAGVWFYHDHSICHHENTALGAIGALVVHNPADAENEVDITEQRLPGGSWIGRPVDRSCVWAPAWLGVLPYAIQGLEASRVTAAGEDGGGGHAQGHGERPAAELADESAVIRRGADAGFAAESLDEAAATTAGREDDAMRPLSHERSLVWGDLVLELGDDFATVRRICFDVYREPPDQALYLLLFHEMPGVGMCINGRKFLGNAPTLVAGPNTRMRFGIIGMGDAFHTFHIHGHRWVVPGPAGTTRAAIESSAQTRATSPFQDTTVFGPASSFAFTLEEGKGMMRADPPIGEWHLHCHVGHHMMEGMVGSLLVVKGGELVLPLPVGRACPQPPGEREPPPPPPKTHHVRITDGVENHFDPWDISIQKGDILQWTNTTRTEHSAVARPPEGYWSSGDIQPGQSWSHQFHSAGAVSYHCGHHRKHGNWWIGAIVRVYGASTGSSTTTPPPPPPAPKTHSVSITSTGFSPSSISIKAGDAVSWTNQDSTTHTATADDHSWGTPNLTAGKSFSRSFTTPGTFPYHCHFHHEMTATIQVSS